MKRRNVILLFFTCLNLNLQSQDTLVMPVTGNGGIFNTCYAVIYDNGLDSNYHNYSHSTITIAPLWVQSVSLYFEEFDTEIHFDSLNIYDGPGTTFPLIGTYSGTTLLGQTISSTGNSITMEFRSDDIQTGTGFKAWVSCIMGIGELMDENIVLYPNPANNYLQLKGIETQNVKNISLLDEMGRIIKTFRYNGQIDVSSLSNGFYGLNIQFKDGRTMFKKWIKN